LARTRPSSRHFVSAAPDGVPDFAGTSGHDFGQHTATDSTTSTLTDASSLALYTGAGSVSFTESAAAASNTTGGGNVLNQINTSASGQVVLDYHYVPITRLRPGAYTLVQPNEPPGYSDGYETSGNQAPIPGTIGTDRIPVTVGSSDVPNNNFGELKASLSGYVYYDPNDNGLKEPGERGIPNTTVTLTGVDASGQAVSKSTTTDGAGFYAFPGLAGGTYILTETQPAGYLDGKDTIGSQGGKTQNDKFFDIPLPGGANGINNNFGELLPPGPTPTPTVTSTTTTPVSTGTVAGARTQNPLGPTTTPTPLDLTRGERTSGVPGTGGGLMSHTGFNIALAALALLAVSGWLAYIGAGQRRTAEVPADDEDAGFGPGEP
jgi:SdrD B-like domain